MDVYLKALRETPPAPGHERVEYAGLRMAENLAERTVSGIPYHREVVDQFRTWATEFGLPDHLS